METRFCQEIVDLTLWSLWCYATQHYIVWCSCPHYCKRVHNCTYGGRGFVSICSLCKKKASFKNKQNSKLPISI